jgi:peptide/nickel transport system permease protein
MSLVPPVPAETGTALDPTSGQAGIADVGAYRSSLREFWSRFCQNRLALGALVVLGLIALLAVFADLIAPYGFAERPLRTTTPPSWDHPFGTDQIGRDILSRVIYGARISLRIGIVATFISVVIGVVAGALAGYLGGWADTIISRLVDVFLAIPYIVLAVSIAAVMGRSENSVIIILGFTGWLAIARIVRSSFIQLKEQEFVEAATALGFGGGRIMFRHILPNALQPIIVYAAIAVGAAILAEAALSFLGAGPVDPTPAWGLMVSTAKGRLKPAPYELLFPALAIVITVLSFLLIGDGLRDALDPKLKNR